MPALVVRRGDRFGARCKVGGKLTWLGTFDTEPEARAAVEAARVAGAIDTVDGWFARWPGVAQMVGDRSDETVEKTLRHAAGFRRRFGRVRLNALPRRELVSWAVVAGLLLPAAPALARPRRPRVTYEDLRAPRPSAAYAAMGKTACLKALAARDNGVPFYVAVPGPTIDWRLADGAGIPIEDRGASEVSHLQGLAEDGRVLHVRLTPAQSAAANPAFDVTPARLVSGLITERGVLAATAAALAAAV